MKAMPLSAFLSRLILLCMGPLALFAAYLSITNVLDKRAEADLEAANLAKNFAAMIDQHLHARISALHILTESPLLDDESRWKDLYREAQGFHQGFGSHVILADLQMHMLFNTRVPFGSELPLLPRPKGSSAVTTVLATGKPAVGDSFFGPIAKEPLVAIAVPVQREGKITLLLLTIFETRTFQEKLDQLALPAGWVLSLLDGKQEALARSALLDSSAAMDLDPAARFTVQSELSPWTVIIEIPRNIYHQPLIRIGLILAVALMTAALVSFLTGTWFSRRLANAVARLSENSSSAPPRLVIAEIEDVRTLLEESAAAKESSDKELRESEARYRSLFHTANVGNSMTFPSGEIRVNKAFCELLGYAPEEMHNKTWHDLTPAEEVKLVTDLLGPLLRGEKDKVRFEKRYIHKNGSHIWTDVSVAIQRDHDGKPAYFITTVIDITERKKAEEELRRNDEALRAGNAELERFNSVAVGRELRMIELKQEVDELCLRLGEPPRYRD